MSFDVDMDEFVEMQKENTRLREQFETLWQALAEITTLMPPGETNGRAYSDARDIAEEVIAAIPSSRGQATYVDPAVGGNPYPASVPKATDWNVVMNAREDENDPMKASNQESKP